MPEHLEATLNNSANFMSRRMFIRTAFSRPPSSFGIASPTRSRTARIRIRNDQNSSIGVGIEYMTSKAKMSAPRWPPGLQDGHPDLRRPGSAFEGRVHALDRGRNGLGPECGLSRGYWFPRVPVIALRVRKRTQSFLLCFYSQC